MKNPRAVQKRTLRAILLTACVAALAAALMVARPQPAHADRVTPPPVPESIAVPERNVAYLVGHAVGTQNYICLPSTTSPTGFAYSLFTPQATLFTDNGNQITTHFFSPNPDEGGTVRAAWQHSRDTSTVWGRAMPGHSSPAPTAGAIPWLLVTVVGEWDAPSGSDTLADTNFIHRLNTTGGVAPSTGCSESTHVGAQAYVPYTADYYFYRPAGGTQDTDD